MNFQLAAAQKVALYLVKIIKRILVHISLAYDTRIGSRLKGFPGGIFFKSIGINAYGQINFAKVHPVGKRHPVIYGQFRAIFGRIKSLFAIHGVRRLRGGNNGIKRFDDFFHTVVGGQSRNRAQKYRSHTRQNKRPFVAVFL